MKGLVTSKKFCLTFLVSILFLMIAQGAAAQKIQVGPVEKIATITDANGLIEGPAYDPEDGYLYLVEIENGWITRLSPGGKYERFYNIGAPGNLMGPNGMIWDSKRNKLLIAHRDKGIVTLDPKTKRLETIVDSYNGKKFNGPNDVVMDSSGNIYFTDPWGTSIDNPNGAVYRIDANTGEVIQLFSHLAFPNGLGISADETYIYVGEFGTNRLLRAFLLDGGKATIFLHAMTYFNGGGGPDGFCLDVKGNLYVAHWASGKVYVIEPKFGHIIEEIEIPDSDAIGPTRCCFGGPDNKTMYITESFKSTIWRVKCSIPGMPNPMNPPSR